MPRKATKTRTDGVSTPAEQLALEPTTNGGAVAIAEPETESAAATDVETEVKAYLIHEYCLSLKYTSGAPAANQLGKLCERLYELWKFPGVLAGVNALVADNAPLRIPAGALLLIYKSKAIVDGSPPDFPTGELWRRSLPVASLRLNLPTLDDAAVSRFLCRCYSEILSPFGDHNPPSKVQLLLSRCHRVGGLEAAEKVAEIIVRENPALEGQVGFVLNDYRKQHEEFGAAKLVSEDELDRQRNAAKNAIAATVQQQREQAAQECSPEELQKAAAEQREKVAAEIEVLGQEYRELSKLDGTFPAGSPEQADLRSKMLTVFSRIGQLRAYQDANGVKWR